MFFIANTLAIVDSGEKKLGTRIALKARKAFEGDGGGQEKSWGCGQWRPVYVWTGSSKDVL